MGWGDEIILTVIKSEIYSLLPRLQYKKFIVAEWILFNCTNSFSSLKLCLHIGERERFNGQIYPSSPIDLVWSPHSIDLLCVRSLDNCYSNSSVALFNFICLRWCNIFFNVLYLSYFSSYSFLIQKIYSSMQIILFSPMFLWL